MELNRKAYEQKLQGPLQSVEEQEKRWDDRADSFYWNQVHGRDVYPEKVVQLLRQKQIIAKETTLLDIGSGSGRYAIPFAAEIKAVHALDVSGNMLAYLKEEMAKQSLENIDLLKSAWPTKKSLDEIDVAFSTMCPATRTIQAIKEMSKTAKKYGVICQYIQMSNSIVQELERQNLIDGNRKDPHNNREIVEAYFNILWQLGYNPEIAYLEDASVEERSLQAMLDLYTSRFNHLDQETLRSAVDNIINGETIVVEKTSTLAVISWKTG